jgi:hypothetical protein
MNFADLAAMLVPLRYQNRGKIAGFTLVGGLLASALVLAACGDGNDGTAEPTPASVSSTTTTSISITTTTTVAVTSGDGEVCRAAQQLADRTTAEAAAELARVAPQAGNEELRAAAAELGGAGAGWGTGHDGAIETIATECNDLDIYVQFP